MRKQAILATMFKACAFVTLAGLGACGDDHDHSPSPGDHDGHDDDALSADLCEHLDEAARELVELGATPETAPELAWSHVHYQANLAAGGWARVLIEEDDETHFGFDAEVEVSLYKLSDSPALPTEDRKALTCAAGLELAYELDVGSYLLKFEPAEKTVGFTWVYDDSEHTHAH